MPTIIRIGPIKIQIYPHDHLPPHIHAVAPECEAKFNIGNMECVSSFGFTQRDLKKIQQYLINKREYLLEVWSEHQES